MFIRLKKSFLKLFFFAFSIYACFGARAESRVGCAEEQVQQYQCANQNRLISERELAIAEKITVDEINSSSWISRRKEFLRKYNIEKLAFRRYRDTLCKFEASFVYYAIEELPAKMRQQNCEERLNDDRKKFLFDFHSIPVI
jgi:hypothetical protein